jgi:hypothetical protein
MIISVETINATLSTIIQTIAAIYAIVGTFILFQIQSTEKWLFDILSEYINNNTREDKTSHYLWLLKIGKYDEISFPMKNPHQSYVTENINNLSKFKNLILTSTITSTILITFSIATIAFIEFLKNEFWFKYYFSWILIFFIWILWYIAYKIYSLFLVKIN